MEHVEVESLAADRWRWIYSDGNGARAVSNELYEELLEAEAAARKAYPDLPIVVAAGLSAEQTSDQRSLLKLVLFVMLGALAIALGWRLAARTAN